MLASKHLERSMAKKADIQSYNVWIWDFNSDSLESYDVIPRFVESIKRYIKPKNLPKTKEALNEILESDARYYFWSKCEYEMIIHGWPEQKNDQKVDVYQQLKLNWPIFLDFFWEQVYKPMFLKKAAKKTSRKSK